MPCLASVASICSAGMPRAVSWSRNTSAVSGLTADAAPWVNCALISVSVDIFLLHTGEGIERTRSPGALREVVVVCSTSPQLFDLALQEATARFDQAAPVARPSVIG